jgi:hypothetical protein
MPEAPGITDRQNQALAAQARRLPDEGRAQGERFSRLADWSGRQDSNLRLPDPEPEREEFHGVVSSGTGSQPVERTEVAPTEDSDTVAPSGYGETPFGAPVVRELPPDPGLHERLLTVRECRLAPRRQHGLSLPALRKEGTSEPTNRRGSPVPRSGGAVLSRDARPHNAEPRCPTGGHRASNTLASASVTHLICSPKLRPPET